MARLTDVSVRSLTLPERGVIIHFDDLVRGFGVRCSQGGGRSYVVQFGQDRRKITIGKVGILGLSEARTAAKRLLAEHTLGQHRAPRVTLAEALQSFLDAKGHTNRPRSMRDTKRILNKHLEHLKAKNLEALTTHAVTKITDDLAKSVPGTARHVFCEARTFFRWCVKRRLTPHSPLEGLEPPTPAGNRYRVLSDDELRAVWKAADATSGHFGIIVKLLILTGQRRGEIGSLKAEWCSLPSSKDGERTYAPAPLGVGGENTDCEVTLVPAPEKSDKCLRQCTITLPSSITKNKRSHTFPIGKMASLLLSSTMPTHADGAFLFPARGKTNSSFNGWSKAKPQLDKLAQIEPWTLHDLRRTYATNLQRLGMRLEVIEALLNHVSGTRAGIVGIYQRHRYEEEMRDAVSKYDTWFNHTILTHEEV